MKLAKSALLLTLASAAVWAQVNAGEQKPEASLPFTMTTTATFELPWRVAFVRVIFDGKGGAKTAERWDVGKRIRDVEQGPDGSLWMLEDANPGALIHVTPK